MSPRRPRNPAPTDPLGQPPPRPAHRRAAWAELLRISAVLTVPGDAVAGAVASGARPNRGTALAVGASLCLYEAGMVLNDWADRHLDAVERPHRPLPSGRIRPGAALAAAAGLTTAGLGLAAAAGRPALATATVLAGTVWAYDLVLKRTAAGPAAMAAARSLDLLLGATATATVGPPADGARRRPDHSGPSGPDNTASTSRPPGDRGRAGRGVTASEGLRAALPSAALLGTHTLAVTAVSRRETEGGSTATPLAAAATTALIAGTLGREPRPGGGRVATLLAGVYAATAGRPLAHAALNPSPHLTQQAVGGGIRAMIPLQSALAARAGARHRALPLLALLPVARRLSGRVSPT
ncbi:SCO3242 family prenyltransferase [Streptomyces sp. TP-A0874]|uniref:SCO3242 family prenyltransferase n=1 Tax=Streptomyces sp. TP-A0874 TaxID=549819 RepID=UPI0009A00BCE|nr:UbiA family prenyltransferase [Streptomyces sp. TP-A0874]